VLADLTASSAPGSRLGLTVSGRGSTATDPVRWLAGHGWAAQVTRAPEVLGARGRPVPVGRSPASPTAALLVSATRDA
jgi:hypothetical protein